MTEVYQGVFSLVGTPRMHGLGSSWRDSWGTYPLGLCSCFIMIQDVLSGEAAAFPTVALEVPWLGMRLWSAWERVPVLPALLPCCGGLTLPAWVLILPAWDWAPVPSALPPGCTLTLPVWKLTLPAWDWMPALLVLPVWVLTLSAWD